MVKFEPGHSYPLRDISKHYGLDYGDVLLYADSLRPKRAYDNPSHEARAVARIDSLMGIRSNTDQVHFSRNIEAVVARLAA